MNSSYGQERGFFRFFSSVLGIFSIYTNVINNSGYILSEPDYNLISCPDSSDFLVWTRRSGQNVIYCYRMNTWTGRIPAWCPRKFALPQICPSGQFFLENWSPSSEICLLQNIKFTVYCYESENHEATSKTKIVKVC